MADYFQDILPPEGETRRPAPEPETAPEKSIRNVNIARRAPSPAADRSFTLPAARLGGALFSHGLVWMIAAAAVIVVGVLGLFALRKTTVTVIPRTHTIVFDNTAPFTAYPIETAASGTLPYAVQTFSFEDSEVVPAKGTTHVESKASGSVTIYNGTSATALKLLKNTRFETPAGLVYRSPAEVIVPGMKGTTPGSVTVTVIADSVGDTYNSGPIQKLTLPGLKGSPTFATVYAKAAQGFTGGFAGEQPQTEPGALDTALAQVRGRLEKKAQDALASAAQADNVTILADLARITYSDLPNMPEGTNAVRIREQISVRVPSFSTTALAGTLAQSVSADAAKGDVRLVPAAGFVAKTADTSSTTLGADAIAFTLSGTAQLVWQVDSAALSAALAGHDQGAFQTIISGFPFVQEAKARIEPFWKSAFPKDPSKIMIVVEKPQKP